MDFKAVATGFCFLEAPRVQDDVVWFSDILVGGIRRLNPDGSVDAFMIDRRWIGGMAINDDGCIICGGPGGVSWFDPSSGRWGYVIQSVNGQDIPGVNDIFPDGHGGLYFGTLDVPNLDKGEMPRPATLYRVDAEGRGTVLREGLQFSNGLGLSPDGRTLYHCETLADSVFAYEVQPDGSLGAREHLVEQKGCDGLAVDREGGIWIACVYDGVVMRVLPDGKIDRREKLPTMEVATLCFGGADGRDMYVAMGSEGGLEQLTKDGKPSRTAKLYHARSDIAGLPVPRTRFRIPR